MVQLQRWARYRNRYRFGTAYYNKMSPSQDQDKSVGLDKVVLHRDQVSGVGKEMIWRRKGVAPRLHVRF